MEPPPRDADGGAEESIERTGTKRASRFLLSLGRTLILSDAVLAIAETRLFSLLSLIKRFLHLGTHQVMIGYNSWWAYLSANVHHVAEEVKHQRMDVDALDVSVP